ncbi:MAG: rod shape-determining protein RodA [Treponema sp.]|jgi:rod shape determining protein RodA|nr:rod shape-determining protein RodA [Treponema sp.]
MKLRDVLEIDFPLFFAALLLTLFGILFIYSSGLGSSGLVVSSEYVRQIVWAAAGVIMALVISFVNFRRIYDISFYLYGGTILLLIYTCFFGRLVNGARAWIGIGSFGIQPAEFAKITTILFLARHLDSTKYSQNAVSRFVLSCVIVVIPMGIVLMQPDFGTSLVFIPILLAMTFIGGIAMRYVAFLGGCIVIMGLMMVGPLWQETILKGALPALTVLTNFRFILVSIGVLGIISLIAFFGYFRFKKRRFYWICYAAVMLIVSLFGSYAAHRVLKEYQIMRLIVFLDPNVDPRGSGWHIIQSMTAIGSGGFMGKGFLQGTQSHYRFLPQQSTDFIFSIFTEEWGFLGGILVFALFLLICLRLIRLMKTTSDTFDSYIAGGLAVMYAFHFLINVGMTMGVMPITGIPLLFMSYGGSALISAMIGIGLAMNIHIRRFRR